MTDGVKAAVGSVVPREKPHPGEPAGQAWTEDQVYERYPKLSAKFA